MLKISNVKIYGLEESIVASGYPMLSKAYSVGEFEDRVADINSIVFFEGNSKADLTEAEKRIKTAKHLGSVPNGTGHDNFLRGIVVQYDVKYPVYWSPQFQRYSGYSDIVSSQSAMHRLTKMDLDECMNEYVLPELVDKLKQMISVYNEALEKKQKLLYKRTTINSVLKRVSFGLESMGDTDLWKEEVVAIEDLYMYIISSCPQGLEKTMRVSTNYLQLKTIWKQRRNHKLYDWQNFCDWIETLPFFKELTGI